MRGTHAALVEGQVHGLHLADLQLPGRQQLLHPAQHLAQEALRLPQDLRPEQEAGSGELGRGVRREGGSGGRRRGQEEWGRGQEEWGRGRGSSSQATGAHLPQLKAPLLQLLQGSVADRLLLVVGEDVAVKAGREGHDMR